MTLTLPEWIKDLPPVESIEGIDDVYLAYYSPPNTEFDSPQLMVGLDGCKSLAEWKHTIMEIENALYSAEPGSTPAGADNV